MDFIATKPGKMLRMALLLSRYDVFYSTFAEMGAFDQFSRIFNKTEKVTHLSLLLGIFVGVAPSAAHLYSVLVPRAADLLESNSGQLVFADASLISAIAELSPEIIDEETYLTIIARLLSCNNIASFQLRGHITYCLLQILQLAPRDAMIGLIDCSLIEALAGFIGMEDEEITIRTLQLLLGVLEFYPSPDFVREGLSEFGCFEQLVEMLDKDPTTELAETISSFMSRYAP
jgi:hypothetical protein